MIAAAEEDVDFSVKKGRIYYPSKIMHRKKRDDPRKDKIQNDAACLFSTMQRNWSWMTSFDSKLQRKACTASRFVLTASAMVSSCFITNF